MSHFFPLIILDRDGVINQESAAYIKTPDEWQPIPGSLDAIARLHRAGYLIAIATNQSGIARGLYDLTTLDAIHEKMHQAVAEAGGKIDAIFYCPHLPSDDCDCRKPKTGLLEQISTHFRLPLHNVPFVGDAWRDIVAAQTVGATPMLVKTGFGKKTIEEHAHKLSNIWIGENLAEAATHLLNNHLHP